MATDLDLTLVRSFVTTARSGNISSAAKVLAQTQPAISQHIRRLEDQLGERLLVRSNVGVAPTLAGERFLGLAERILALSDAALDEMRRPLTDRYVNIDLPIEMFGHKDVSVLSDLGAAYPGTRANVRLDTNVEIARLAREGDLQLFVSDPALIADPPCEMKRVELSWICAPRFDTQRRPLPLVLWREPCAWRQAVLKSLDEAGIAWVINFEADSVAKLHAAARDGLGLTIAPARRRVPGLTRPEITSLPSTPVISIGIYGRLVDERYRSAVIRLISN
jgi:DNA-binding transcriptional LysR family regulator